MQIKQTS